MTVVLALMVIALALVLCAVLLASYHLHRQDQDDLANERAHHERCHIEMSALFKDVHIRRISAEALRSAARKYDDPAELGNHRRLANEKYVPGGPSMPVLWLEALADSLDATADTAVEEYELDGSRVL